MWLCECQCKNKTKRVLRACYLKNGHAKSCGCIENHNPHALNLIGYRFGKLVVINRYWGNEIPNSGQCSVWLCKCDCGGTKIARCTDLLSGKVQSCGCLRSVAEEELNGFLQLHQIIFQPQYRIGCTDINELPFDFAIFDDYFDLKFLIELNGFYHYGETKRKNAGEKLLYTQYHDYIKQTFCSDHNIDLLTIPYWRFNEKENIVTEKLKWYGIYKRPVIDYY
jgi:hypothetical protein